MRRFTKKAWLVGATMASALALVPAASLGANSVAYANINVNTLQGAVDHLMNQYVGYGYFSGSVLLARHGSIYVDKGYGYANTSKNIANTSQTRYAIGPLTETFTAAAVLQLVDEGKLNLNDSMYKYYRDLPQTSNVTIRELLTHTSGIHADPKKHASNPGVAFEYSPINYSILGDIIAKVSGESYTSYVQNHILTPLGLNDTGFISSMSNVANSAVGYTKDANKHTVSTDYKPVAVSVSSEGMYSTVGDLYKWDQALHTEKVINYHAIQQIFTSDPIAAKSLKTVGYGFGWLTTLDGRLAKTEGSVPGYRVLMDRDIGDDATLIILSNEDWAPVDDMAGHLAALLMDTQLPGGNAASTVSGQKSIVIDGRTISRPSGRVSSGTMHMPIWYVGLALQQLGVKQRWDGVNHVWTITLPSSVKVDFSNIQLGVGNTDIVVNGQLVRRMSTYAWTDPSTGKATTYAPIYYVQQILEAAGIYNTWNGFTWSASVSAR